MFHRDILIGARKRIENIENWCQGEYRIGDCRCAMGALADEMDLDPNQAEDSHVAALLEKEAAGMRKVAPSSHTFNIIELNDHKGLIGGLTAHEAVMVMFERAIEKAA